MTLRPARLPRAFSAVLLGLLLAFNAITSALHPALPGVGEAAVSKIAARAPLVAQFREPGFVLKASADRAAGRHDDDGPGGAALPPATWALLAPVTSSGSFHTLAAAGSPSDATRAYRARAPPFAA